MRTKKASDARVEWETGKIGRGQAIGSCRPLRKMGCHWRIYWRVTCLDLCFEKNITLVAFKELIES